LHNDTHCPAWHVKPERHAGKHSAAAAGADAAGATLALGAAGAPPAGGVCAYAELEAPSTTPKIPKNRPTCLFIGADKTQG
jgi:hypothetical protein